MINSDRTDPILLPFSLGRMIFSGKAAPTLPDHALERVAVA
jgi:hypothetical protein